MKVHFEHIYENIGFLFYAVASERGRLNAVTYDRLRRLVERQWRPAGNGETIESQLVYYLHSAMYEAYNQALPPEQAFERFKRYFRIHSLPFGSDLRTRIFSTADMLASEFSIDGKQSTFLNSLAGMFRVPPIALA
jgi:hypothetical protein